MLMHLFPRNITCDAGRARKPLQESNPVFCAGQGRSAHPNHPRISPRVGWESNEGEQNSSTAGAQIILKQLKSAVFFRRYILRFNIWIKMHLGQKITNIQMRFRAVNGRKCLLLDLPRKREFPNPFTVTQNFPLLTLMQNTKVLRLTDI